MANEGEVKKIVNIKPLKIKFIDVNIEGLSSLLMNKQSERTKEALRRYSKDSFEKQGKDKNKDLKRTKKGEVITDEELMEEKIHYMEDNKVGFPVMGFKLGMVAVAPRLGIFKNSLDSVQILGNIVPIEYTEKKMHKTMGRTAGRNKTPQEIIRPEFTNWKCKLTVKFNSEIINEEQLVNILNWAGGEIGLGDWRPQKFGSYGMYRVATS